MGAGPLRDHVSELPERQRLVLFLRYYADLDYRAIASAVGISVGTVGSTLNAAHAALRDALPGGGKRCMTSIPRWASCSRPARRRRPSIPRGRTFCAAPAMPSRCSAARRVPPARWLMLAAALAIPAGIAAATARHELVDYLSGGASRQERHHIAPYVHGFASHPGIHADLRRMRRLVAVTVGGHRHVFVMAPLTRGGSGGCIYEVVGDTVTAGDCGLDPRARHPAVSPPDVVGTGTALGAESFQVGRGPVWVVLGVMPAARGVVSVRVRFQDGTVARGGDQPGLLHVRRLRQARPRRTSADRARRPKADRAVGALQRLDPGGFDLAAIRRAQDSPRPPCHVDFLEHGVAYGVPPRQITALVRVSTTRAKVARMFGGAPSRFPPRPVVVVVRGPFTIRRPLPRCRATPSICPAPLGRWAYLAVVLDPDAYHGGIAPPGAIAWLRQAPIGTPFPDLARLGRVIPFAPPRPRHQPSR